MRRYHSQNFRLIAARSRACNTADMVLWLGHEFALDPAYQYSDIYFANGRLEVRRIATPPNHSPRLFYYALTGYSITAEQETAWYWGSVLMLAQDTFCLLEKYGFQVWLESVHPQLGWREDFR